jgi:hypothetical protein
VPRAEHGRLQVPQARGPSCGRQPDHDRPAAHAAQGVAVVGEFEVAAGLACQSAGVDDADFQLRGDTGAGAGSRRRTRRVLAAARSHNQPACHRGQNADSGRAATGRGSGEPTTGRRSCPRITDHLKPHCVSLCYPGAYQPEMTARRDQQRRSRGPMLARWAPILPSSALGASVIADDRGPEFRATFPSGHRLRLWSGSANSFPVSGRPAVTYVRRAGRRAPPDGP